MSQVTIYHNPVCGTSRKTLEIIRSHGIAPAIIHYLETPPTRDELVKLITDMGTRLCRPAETVLEILPDSNK